MLVYPCALAQHTQVGQPYLTVYGNLSYLGDLVVVVTLVVVTAFVLPGGKLDRSIL